MTDPNPFETEDLRAWGYAPGSYVFKCQDCPPDLDIYDKMGRLGDKRSWRCEEHARAARDATPSLSPQTLPALGEVDHIADAGNMVEVERIRRAIWGYVNAQPEDAATLSVVQFLANRDVFLAEAIAPVTVAAANDEEVGKAIDALKPLAEMYLTGSEPDDECVIDASNFPNAGHVRAARAAIRLLSQGERG